MGSHWHLWKFIKLRKGRKKMIKIIYMHLLILIAPKDIMGFSMIYYGRKVDLGTTNKLKELSAFDFLVKVDELK